MRRRDFLRSMLWSTAVFAAGGIFKRAHANIRFETKDVSSFAVIGDSGYSEASSAALRAKLKAKNLTQVFLAGDNLYPGVTDLETSWNPWRDEGFEFPLVAIGNHTPGIEKELQYFGLERDYYARQIGSSRFLILNSNNRKNVPEQMAWLEGQLRTSRSANTFLVYHHPSFTLGAGYHKWQDRAEFQSSIRPLIRDYAQRINAVIVGHDHIAAVYAMNDVPMIVCGAAIDAFPAVEASGTIDGLTLSTQWRYSGDPTWARLDIDKASGKAAVSFIDVATDGVMYTRSLNRVPTDVEIAV